MNQQTFNKVIDMNASLAGRQIVSWGICYDGTMAALAVESADSSLPFERSENTFASFPATQSSEAFGPTLLRLNDASAQDAQAQIQPIQDVALPSTTAAYPHVQVFPNGEILIVSARCSKTKDGPELNATVYSSEGKELRNFCIGDGVQDLRIDARGEIWASYFDEGIFGNCGWDEDGVGRSGLCSFDAFGNVTWTFEPPDALYSIDDCYAMSLDGGDVVACYYSSFPIVRISQSDKKISLWNNEHPAATAIAVSGGGRVVLFGGYGDEHTRCVTQTLGTDGEAHDIQVLTLAMPPEYSGETVSGRNNELHTVVNGVWWKASF